MADKPTLDGFYPRRPNTRVQVGGMGFNGPTPVKVNRHAPPVLKPAHPATKEQKATFTVPHPAHRAPQQASTGDTGLSRSELEESLREIDEDSAAITPVEYVRKAPKEKKRFPSKKFIIRTLIVLVLLGAGIAGYVVVKGMLAGTSIFKGDIFGLVQQKKLQQDASGRTNILIFGTSEDDEGGEHPGAYLTDSIMLLSIDQTKKDAYMVGIPRDLWVKYDTSCYYGGDEGKINSLYQCYSDSGKNEEAGSKALTGKVSQVTGLEVQYYAHVNYSVVRDSVEAVGGIDVTIESPDPRGIYDPNFDWKCKFKCHMVDYKNGQLAHLDGEHALALARARNAEGGYGLPAGNYDREKNQQKILVALRNKATSAGTLTNIVAVTKLIDAMGKNLRTNFEMSEIRTLMALGVDIKPEAIHSIDLNKDGERATTTGSSADRQSIVQAISGVYDYTSIVKYIKKQINSEPYMTENAQIAVLNGSGVVGQAKLEADRLSDTGFTIAAIENAPKATYADREVYARSTTAKPGTLQKLQSLYGTVNTTGIEKFTVPTAVDFVIVVGKANATQTP